MNTSITWNYRVLFEEGIRLIEELSSSVWTDYNAHDPGITTLEYLCYALTDLAGRVGLPLESHLAEKIGERIRLRNDFPEAHEILPCGAVTVGDYRKLLIDLPGIRGMVERAGFGGTPEPGNHLVQFVGIIVAGAHSDGPRAVEHRQVDGSVELL